MGLNAVSKIDIIAVQFFSEAIEVMVVPADLQEFGNSFLVNCRLRNRLYELLF